MRSTTPRNLATRRRVAGPQRANKFDLLGFLPKSLTFGANDIQGVDFQPYPAPAIDAAIEWLRSLLAHGPMASPKVRNLAKRHGIAHTTLYKARRRLGISTVGEWGLA